MDKINAMIELSNLNAMLEIVSPAALLILLASLIILLASFRTVNRVTRQNQQYQHTIAMLKRDMHALTSAAVNVGKRVHELERKPYQQPDSPAKQQVKPTRTERVKKPVLKKVEQDFVSQQVFHSSYEPANQPYEHAIRMAQRGARTEELMATCGLSPNEAELISMLHRMDKTA